MVWSDECQQAFNTIQYLLTNEPILQLPDFKRSFILESDASQCGAGSVLSQERDGIIKPVAYYSRSLSKPEKNYSTIERELLSIVISVEHFRQFLYGKRFKIFTDHKPLIYCFTAKDPAPRIARWLLRLNNYEFDIEYRAGKSNGNADALSRLMDDSCESEGEHYEDIMINHLFGDDQIDDSDDQIDDSDDKVEEFNVDNIPTD